MESQLTQQLLHKIGSRRIALISLEKMNGYQIRQIYTVVQKKRANFGGL